MGFPLQIYLFSMDLGHGLSSRRDLCCNPSLIIIKETLRRRIMVMSSLNKISSDQLGPPPSISTVLQASGQIIKEDVNDFFSI
jgi:hypothetical protein